MTVKLGRSIATNYGPKVTWDQLQVGVRIYYTGDMANPSGHGVITRRHEPNKWGYQQVDIQLDDGGHLWRGVMLGSFQPAPGRRFWLETDWQADRDAKIAAMRAEYERRITA
jgi:hypothetical protein